MGPPVKNMFQWVTVYLAQLSLLHLKECVPGDGWAEPLGHVIHGNQPVLGVPVDVDVFGGTGRNVSPGKVIVR